MKIQRFNKQLNNDRNLLIIGIIVVVSLSLIGIISIIHLINKPTGYENITTLLKHDRDFLEWFNDFDMLYNNKVKVPEYSLNENIFKEINSFINGKNESRISFKDNKYLMNDATLELDVNTRSLRYIRYNKEIIIELLEINLINGKYYVILITEDWEYKIRFNKDDVKIDKAKNKKKLIAINKRIFGTNDFEW